MMFLNKMELIRDLDEEFEMELVSRHFKQLYLSLSLSAPLIDDEIDSDIIDLHIEIYTTDDGTKKSVYGWLLKTHAAFLKDIVVDTMFRFKEAVNHPNTNIYFCLERPWNKYYILLDYITERKVYRLISLEDQDSNHEDVLESEITEEDRARWIEFSKPNLKKLAEWLETAALHTTKYYYALISAYPDYAIKHDSLERRVPDDEHGSI